jgi:broad specificity phosphatase PhoE
MDKEKLDSLTPRGIEQARKTGAYLKDKNIFAVISSPTGRTRQTARIIAEEIGLKGSFSEDSAFSSMKKGRTSKGKVAGWSWRTAQWRAGRDPRPEGGESLEDATKRAVQALKVLIGRYPGKVFVIVTHSDICAGLAGYAGDTPYPERYEKYKISPGSVINIRVSPEGT